MVGCCYSPPFNLSPGDAFVLTLLKQDGTAYDLDDWDVRAQIKNSIGTTIGEFSITTVNADQGIARFAIPNPGSFGYIPPGKYVFNILLYQGAIEDRLKPMILKVLPPITTQ